MVFSPSSPVGCASGGPRPRTRHNPGPPPAPTTYHPQPTSSFSTSFSWAQKGHLTRMEEGLSTCPPLGPHALMGRRGNRGGAASSGRRSRAEGSESAAPAGATASYSRVPPCPGCPAPGPGRATTTTPCSGTRRSQPSSRLDGTTRKPGRATLPGISQLILLCRFWQLKIHEDTDRRQTKSQIEFGSDGDSVKDHAEVTKESTEDEASKDGEQEEEDDVRSLGDYGYGGQVGHTPPHTLKPSGLFIYCVILSPPPSPPSSTPPSPPLSMACSIDQLMPDCSRARSRARGITTTRRRGTTATRAGTGA